MSALMSSLVNSECSVLCPTKLLNATISINEGVVVRSNLLMETYISLSTLFCTTIADEALLFTVDGKNRVK